MELVYCLYAYADTTMTSRSLRRCPTLLLLHPRAVEESTESTVLLEPAVKCTLLPDETYYHETCAFCLVDR